MMSSKSLSIFIIILFLSIKLCSQESSQSVLDLSLTELLNQEVTVASKKPQTISESPGIISVISSEDMKELGIINLSEVFLYIPGFTVSDNYWNREVVTARELSQALYNDKILLLIDGIPAYEAINTEYYLDLIPIEAIDKIEVIRGPGSTLYGTNAFAAVINIISRSGDQVDGIEVTASGGSNNFVQKSVTVGKKSGDLNLIFSGKIRDHTGETLTIPFDELGNRDLKQSYRKEFSKGFLKLNYKNFTASFQLLDLEYEHFGMVPREWAQGTAKQNTLNFNFSYHYNLNKKLKNLNTFRVMRQTRNNEAGIFGTLFPDYNTTKGGIEVTAPTYINWKSYIYQFETQWNYTFNNNLSFVGGSTIERRDPYNITTMFNSWGFADKDIIKGLEGSYKYPPEKEKLDFGIYLQGDLRLKRLGLVGGLRYTHMGVSDKSFMAPRVALIYKITEHLNFKSLFGMAFRSPSIYETDAKVMNTLYGGRKNIKPEKVTTYEFGLDYLGKNFSARLNFYMMSVKDIIVRREMTEDEKRELEASSGVIYDNANNQKLKGLEFEIKAYPYKNLKLFFNGSLREGKDTDKDKSLEYLANRVFSGGFNLKIPSCKIFICPSFYFVDKREGTALDGKKYSFDKYFIVNFKLGFKFTRSTIVSLIGKNIFNKTYFYPENTRNRNGIQLPGNPSASLFVKIEHKFRF